MDKLTFGKFSFVKMIGYQPIQKGERAFTLDADDISVW